MDKPLVSIIIPCFNAEKWVGESIESALGQTYVNKEVIVIDDGSTDNSLEVIRSFGSRIRWETGPNRGATLARNRGIAMATGDLIQFHDADDILYPQKLEKQVPLVVQDDNALVYCDWENLDPGGVMKKQAEPCYDEDPVVFMVMRSVSGIAPIHWKNRLMEVSCFRADLPCAQEYDLQIRLACKGVRLTHMPEVLFMARKRKESISGDYARVLDQFEGILWPIYRSLQESGGMTEVRRVAFAEKMASTARFYIRIGKKETAARHFAAALQMHPEAGLTVYSRPARLLRHVIGPYLLEKLMIVKRKVI